MRILAITNLKGGVGKTTTAVNLAYLSAQDGHRTVVWDLDPQGSASFYFRIKAKVKGGGSRMLERKKSTLKTRRGTDFEGLDLIPADFSYRKLDRLLEKLKKPDKRIAKQLKPLRSHYDHLFIDCPPSFTKVTESVLAASDVVLIPSIPSTLSLETLARIRKHLEASVRRSALILPFFSMVDRRKRMHRDLVDAVPSEYEFLEATVPYASVIEQMGVERAPVGFYDPNGPAAEAFRALWAEIRSRAAIEQPVR